MDKAKGPSAQALGPFILSTIEGYGRMTVNFLVVLNLALPICKK